MSEEGWYYADEVRVGDVLLKYRVGTDEERELGTIFNDMKGLVTRINPSAYNNHYYGTTGVFEPGNDRKVMWHLRRAGESKRPAKLEPDVTIKATRCIFCESKRCPGTCAAYFAGKQR